MTLRKRTHATVSIAILLALTGVPALTGCSLAEGVIEQATGGNVEVSTGSLPEGWPTEIPVVDGEIQFGGFVADGENKAYNVTVKVTGDSPVEAIKTALSDAGLTAQGSASTSEDGGATLIYSGDAWGAAVVVAPDGGAWIVNYTVTSV